MCAVEPRPEIGTDRLILRAQAGVGVAFDIEHRQFGHIGRVGFQEDQPRRPELDVWLEPPFRALLKQRACCSLAPRGPSQS